MARILVVEDEPDIALALKTVIGRTGHECEFAADGPSAVRMAHEVRPNLMLLDVGLPGMDGWEVLDRVRAFSDVPVLLLTAAGSSEDKVRGLRAGADDYLTKPFSNPELLARVDALLRRAGDAEYDNTLLSHNGVVVSPASHTVTVNGTNVALTPQEFRLLTQFLRNPGQVLTTEQLLDRVWGDSSGQGGDRVKFAVLRLRKKLGWDQQNPSPLAAVRGLGYRLDSVAS